MSNNTQSSVEWLFDELTKYFHIESEYKNTDDILIKAKAMHKEETTDFANKSIKMALCEDIQNPFNLDEIYNETFGGNNE